MEIDDRKTNRYHSIKLVNWYRLVSANRWSIDNHTKNRSSIAIDWHSHLEQTSRTVENGYLWTGRWREYCSPVNFQSIKVIPLFCTAHPLLRITMLHPRWRRFFPLARKERTRAAFAELKLLFAIIMPQIDWQLPGLLSKNKKMKEMFVIPKSAVVFHFAAVELWNY